MNLLAQKTIRPNYYRHFHCTPDDCLETCCERWQIQIDRWTYDRYQHADDEAIQRLTDRYVHENVEAKGDHDFARITLDPLGRCPFLTDGDYCSIQIKMGEESLSETCRTYPRVITKIDDRRMLGLEPTCSVAAGLILFDPEAMTLDPPGSEEEVETMIEPYRSLEDQKATVETLWLQQQVMAYLSDRAQPMEERLFRSGIHLRGVLAGHRSDEPVEERSHHVFNDRAFEHLNHLLSVKFATGDRLGFFSKRYPRILNDVLDGMERMPKGKEENAYRLAYCKGVRPYLDQRPYLIENYIVNHVYLYGSILMQEKRAWRSYLEICLLVALLQFHLVGLVLKKKRLSDALVLSFFEAFSRTFLQDRTYFNEAILYLISQKLDTPEAIIGLVHPEG